jgi:hypothetical protein
VKCQFWEWLLTTSFHFAPLIHRIW